MQHPGDDSPPAVRYVVLSLIAFLVPPLLAGLAHRGVPGLEPLVATLILLPALFLGYWRGPRGALLGAVAAVLSGGAAHVVSAGDLFAEGWSWAASAAVFAGVLALLGVRFRGDLVRAETMALTDNLTRLPNRRHALTFIESRFAAAERGAGLCVVLFDLDHFKRFNDELGHGAGDLALRAFADVLRDNTRRMNLSARMGGEEFVSVLTDATLEGAVTFARRVRRALGSVRFSDQPLTVSAGIAVYHPAMKGVDDLLAAADHALYRAKRDGRDCVRVFGSEEQVASSGGDEGGPTRPVIEPVGADRTVLVVHPDGERRVELLEALHTDGFGTLAYEQGADALETLERRPDVLIVDLHLPDGDGPRLCRTFKARWPSLPVLALSEPVDERSLGAVAEARADRYLIQPIAPVALRQTLAELLAQRRPPPPHRGGERSPERESLLIQLADAVEEREEYGAGHGRRVQAAAELLGTAWARADRPLLDLEGLSLGARLHDLGRLAVPAPLLNKVVPLTVEEFRAIQRYPVVGQSLVEVLLGGTAAPAVVRWHAERWDGTGYPDGLAGRSIPAEARICAVADALDAMTTYRRYRPPLAFDAALEHIRAASGRHFDPLVVELLDEVAAPLAAVLESFRTEPESARTG